MTGQTMEQMRVGFETITPDLAREYINANIDNNRSVSRRWVDGIVDLMERDQWKDNGESIKFQQANGDGIERLIDGQHRLHAILKLNKPVQMLVVRNLPPTVFYTIDAGKKRTAADVLSIAGYKQSTTLAAATRLLCNFENDHTFKINFKQVPSIDIMKMVERFPDIQDSVNLGHKGRFIVAGSLLVFLHFIMSKDNPELASDFITKLTEGVSMVQGDPILTFRDRMFRYRAQNMRLRRQFQIGLLFKTWNYAFEGRIIDKLKFGPKEEFPILKGFDRKALFGSDYPVEEEPETTEKAPKVKVRKNGGSKGVDKQKNLF